MTQRYPMVARPATALLCITATDNLIAIRSSVIHNPVQ